MADTLSRVTYGYMELGTLFSTHGIDWDMLQEEVKKDMSLVRILFISQKEL